MLGLNQAQGMFFRRTQETPKVCPTDHSIPLGKTSPLMAEAVWPSV